MKKKILIIEDEQHKDLRAINKLKEFYDVEIAISVIGAENYLKIKKFDMIILDVIMHWGSYGYDKTKEGMITGWIYYNDKLKNLSIPIIVWTRNDDVINKEDYVWGANVKNQIEKVIGDNQYLINAVNKVFT